MKKFLLSALVLIGLAVGASAQNLRPGDVKIEKVTPTFVKTPDFALAGGSLKRFKPADWLEVEVEFQTAAELIDELTFTYRILLNGKMLVGEVTHVAIPKGREHYSIAYVSPRSLEAIMAGKAANASAIQGVWVEVAKQGMVIAKVPMTAVPNVQSLPNQVLNKSQTPFAPLYWDRYEALKPAVR